MIEEVKAMTELIRKHNEKEEFRGKLKNTDSIQK